MILRRRKLKKPTIPPFSLVKKAAAGIDKIIGRDYLDNIDFSDLDVLDDLPEAWKDIITKDTLDILLKTAAAYGALSALSKYVKITKLKRIRHYRYKIRRRRVLLNYQRSRVI